MQAASTLLLAVGILSFQAASGVHDALLGAWLVAASALPVLLLLRGPWQGMAATGTLMASFAALL